MSFQDFHRVYVWELPVRIFHWVNALSIFTLIATGLLIGNPPALMSGAEATNQYWFGFNRFIHFSAAYIFTFNWLYRIFWGLVGNKYVRWRAFFPFTKKKWSELLGVLRVDVLLQKPINKNQATMSVGHNQLAYLSYFFFFVLCVVQIATGFALLADTSSWWFAGLFAWFKEIFGGDIGTRQFHHIIMWVMVIFTIIHVYLVFYHDWLEGRGIVSSMFGGYKFIKRERLSETK
jgi:Ni/Fe-hydrogenase 1 B-type cytochrome subunit